MKTQISRNAFDPQKQYTGVYQQQGRMITDADWNALTDVGKLRLVQALAEAVGDGSPRDAGIALNPDLSLQPGVVYAGGHRAHLPGDAPVGLASQPDYPSPPALPASDFLVYLDLWERTVTALEDPDLMDAGLHGADTTSRSQQMLQAKWVPAPLNPLDTQQNPQRGSSTLALQLRQILVGSDPCDPCASEVDLDERVGNYLYRVELHDVYVDSSNGHSMVTLKWSRDNGAESYPTENIPDGYDVGDRVWEFFDVASEKSAGRHFPLTHRPRRGVLRTEFSVPTGGEPADFVRQWDGYAIVDLDNETVVEGIDGAATLSDRISSDAQGFVAFDGGELTINGELLLMRWRYRSTDSSAMPLLAGDFWQAEVREAVRAPGDFVLGNETNGEAADGITHHYVLLGRVDGSGNVLPRSDAEQRQFNFPPLTDIRAADVGFDNACPDLYGPARNVQEALAALCAIDAGHIAWEDQGCANSVRELLSASVSAWSDLDSDGKTSVKDALEGLYCHLNATHLPLDKSDEDLCAILQPESVVSVQDALKVLCEQRGGGCAIPVNPGSQLMELLRAFAENEFADIWFCLRPGEHRIDGDLAVLGKNSLKLVGAGRNASLIRFSGSRLELEATEIHLEHISLVTSTSQAGVVLRADTMSACHCEFDRATGNSATAMPLLSWEIMAANPSDASLYWQNNRMSSYWRRRLIEPGVIAPGNVVGPQLSDRVKNLFTSETLLADEAAMQAEMLAVAADILALSDREKSHWSDTMDRNVVNFRRDRIQPIVVTPGDDGTVARPIDVGTIVRPRGGGGRLRPGGGNVVMSRPPGELARPVRPVLREQPLARTGEELALIGRETIAGSTVAEVAEQLDMLVASVVVYEYNPVLGLASAEHRGSICDNQFEGDVQLVTGRSKGVELRQEQIEGVFSEILEPVMGDGELVFGRNRVHRVVSMIESGSIAEQGGRRLLMREEAGYRNLVISENRFGGKGHSFLGSRMHCHGNQFPEHSAEALQGVALCQGGIFSANIGVMDPDRAFNIATPDKSRIVDANNLMRFRILG